MVSAKHVWDIWIEEGSWGPGYLGPREELSICTPWILEGGGLGTSDLWVLNGKDGCCLRPVKLGSRNLVCSRCGVWN